MAKEIKYINEQERVNAMALSLAEVKENFDKTMPYVHGRADGLAEGLEKGEIKGRNEAINSMYKKGLDSKEIARLLDLNISYVESVINNNL